MGSVYALTPQARSLQFFTEKTLAGLQNFFPDHLWNTKILQVAQSTECIRNAVIALASFHEQYLRLNSVQQSDSRFGLGHYNLAIRQLISFNEESSPPHIPILSCLIFLCIEVGSVSPSLGCILTPSRSSKAKLSQPSRSSSMGAG